MAPSFAAPRGASEAMLSSEKGSSSPVWAGGLKGSVGEKGFPSSAFGDG